MRSWRRRVTFLPAVLFAPAALAHVGQGEAHDFLHGLLHPLTGLDHALAMIAVGALAWSLGGRARWKLPAAFMTMVACGMATGLEGYVFPHGESTVAASVAAMGFMLLAGGRLPTAVALPLVGVFGVLHGNAHGAEMDAATLATHGAGFVLGTACLHAAGLALGAAVSQFSKPENAGNPAPSRWRRLRQLSYLRRCELPTSEDS